MSDQGGCLCGAVRYEVDGAPLRTAHCHCESCRRAVGAVVATFACFPAAAFRYIKGAPAVYQSSPGVRRTFCRRCGTSLTYQGDKWANEIHVLVATFDYPENFPTTHQAFAAERIPWFHIGID